LNKTNEVAKKLNLAIKNTEEFKHYFHSLNMLNQHKELYELETELKTLQQQILKERTKEDGSSYDLEVIYHQKMELFQNHPLIVNYLDDKENLSSLIHYIQTYIQGLLDKAS